MRFALTIAALIATGVQAVSWPQPEADATLLRRLVDSGTLPDLRWAKFSAEQTEVAKFYASRGYSLAWARDRAPTPQAEAVIRFLQGAGAKGLDPEDYDGSRWAGRLARLRPASPQPSDEEMVRFDLALTVSVLRCVSDLHIGKVNPKVFCFGLDTEQKECDLAGLLSERLVNARNVQAVIEQLEPPFEGYRRTEKALQTYIELAKADDGEVLPATKKPIEPGDSYAGITRLERLLRRIGDLAPSASASADSQMYSGPLVEAVKHFQGRHGLDPDGRIGKATLKQLNTPLSYRLRQLQLVLERWRWIRTVSLIRPSS